MMTLEDFEREMREQGFTIPQLINYCGKTNSSLLKLDDASLTEFCGLFDQIDAGQLDRAAKGRALERLTQLLFVGDGLFDLRRDFHTSTNEIDLLLTWSHKARNAAIGNAFPCFGDMFICECKAYSKPVDVTYVGKFYSLLRCSGVGFGVLVAWEGITGRSSWMDAEGLIKKVALCDGIYIVVLDRDDLKQICDGCVNVYSLLMDKKNALQSDTSYDKYISTHEAEATFSAECGD